MIEDWLKVTKNYIIAWLLTALLAIFAAYVNVEVRQSTGEKLVEHSVLHKK